MAVANPVPADTTALTAPRVGLFQRYRGGNMDEGWTRLLFEQFDVPFTTVRDADLKAGGLDSKFDVIVLPAGNYGSAIGEQLLARLREWVRNGGTLVTLGEASRWATADRVNLLGTYTELRDGRPDLDRSRLEALAEPA